MKNQYSLSKEILGFKVGATTGLVSLSPWIVDFLAAETSLKNFIVVLLSATFIFLSEGFFNWLASIVSKLEAKKAKKTYLVQIDELKVLHEDFSENTNAVTKITAKIQELQDKVVSLTTK